MFILFTGIIDPLTRGATVVMALSCKASKLLSSRVSFIDCFYPGTGTLQAVPLMFQAVPLVCLLGMRSPRNAVSQMGTMSLVVWDQGIMTQNDIDTRIAL